MQLGNSRTAVIHAPPCNERVGWVFGGRVIELDLYRPGDKAIMRMDIKPGSSCYVWGCRHCGYEVILDVQRESWLRRAVARRGAWRPPSELHAQGWDERRPSSASRGRVAASRS